ncbi:LL-diaminopimelate aminotransferase [Candidatus Proelusimicrobium excrementi]|uniref:LL-diaminopimelate aminotransferase n=1 Tax=Candidatus Proelusimicrobium excrementi TaxID=3416222 RepID=UPI003D108D9D
MIKINENYLNLEQNYLFPTIAKKVREYKAANPSADVISLGIGDVTRALPKACVNALHKASEEMGHESTFRGYGPEQGYSFLIDAIIENDYKAYGIDLQPEEVFVSDGAKCDVGNIQEVFSADAVAAVADPVYPVYLDTNIMAGRAVKKLPCLAENGFAPKIPDFKADLIYLCSPNNPTGAVATYEQLQEWVNYALANDSILLYDGAYEAFISDTSIPSSIYAIPGARQCAIEFRSFSKQGGFTGVRCGYVVIPKELRGRDAAGNKISVSELWKRRTGTKFNGASYIVQRGAAALFTDEGLEQTKSLIDFYLSNAGLLRAACMSVGLNIWGGIHAPYIWVQTPEGMKSWDFFDKMLREALVVITPGAGFGAHGEGFFRISAFNSRDNVEEVCRRIKRFL